MNLRQLTPSMPLLVAFEAAAKHESYTLAAQELFLTQSAISKQIQHLERHLGVKLFQRVGRQVELTPAGRKYYGEIKDALASIRRASLQAITSDTRDHTLHLATLPTFGSKWLLPSLHDFYAHNAHITLHIHSRIGPVDFSDQEIDAAITVGSGNWPNLIAHPIQNEQLIAIVSPDKAQPHELSTEWVAQQSLLTIASNPKAWHNWFLYNGLDPQTMRPGPSFELTSHLTQAVHAGLGVGLVPHILVKDEIARGELLAIGTPRQSQRSYYLVYPPQHATLPALVAFKEWVLSLKSPD